MNSEEALFELYKQIKTHRRTSKKIIENKQQYKQICKDLEVLDILKRSIFNKEEHKYVMTKEFIGQKFMLLNLSVKEDDITKIKEWLEK